MALKIAGDTIISDSGKTLAELVAEVEASTATGTTLQKAYPVGSVYLNVSDSRNPKDIFGFGTWVQIAGHQYLIGQDSNYTNFKTGGQTGGSWGHTHTYSHTHGVPGVKHKHGKGTLYAMIAFSSSYLWNQYTESYTFKANARKTVSGTSADSTQTPSDSTEIGGSTADATPSATTTNSQSATTTSSTDTVLPYCVVYVWKRTA